MLMVSIRFLLRWASSARMEILPARRPANVYQCQDRGFALKSRFPAIYDRKESVDAGGSCPTGRRRGPLPARRFTWIRF